MISTTMTRRLCHVCPAHALRRPASPPVTPMGGSISRSITLMLQHLRNADEIDYGVAAWERQRDRVV
uniref:Uncharacterized protein n=1 Tax=Oryza sativa subsp. japonica TaxID=39947 RepID=Q84YW8_ORYSJ|nr:hypothetical protein [Oryza sativa Japonica Group]